MKLKNNFTGKMVLTLGLWCLFTQAAFARTLVTRIMSMQELSDGSGYTLQSSTDGREYRVEAKYKSTITKLIEAQKKGQLVEIQIKNKDDMTVERATKLADGQGVPVTDRNIDIDRTSDMTLGNGPFESTPYGTDYKPSILNSISFTNEVFDAIRSSRRDSEQCYRRAHIWTEEMWENYGINSGKIYIFFGKKFRDQSGWKWWYHAAPYVWAKDDAGQPVEMVFEKKHASKRPVTVQSWIEQFGKTKNQQCLNITDGMSLQDYHVRNRTIHPDPNYYKVVEYPNYDGIDCFIARAPMFYYSPDDMNTADGLSGEEKRNFKMSWNRGELEASKNEFPSSWFEKEYDKIKFDLDRTKLPADMREH